MHLNKLFIFTRRIFFLFILIFFFLIYKFKICAACIPVFVLVLYTGFIEALYLKKIKISKYEIIFIYADLFFNLLFIFFFSRELFQLFFIAEIFSLRYFHPFKTSILPASLSLAAFIIVSLILMNTYNAEIIIINLILEPCIIALSFVMGGYLSDINRDEKEELKETKNQLKMKNSILSTLSHELNTPLAMIKTSSEIVLEERPGKLNKTQKDFLNIILSNSLRLIKFISNILIQIKIEHTWLKLKIKPVDIRPVIKNTISSIKPILDQKEQAIRYSFPNLLSKAFADENWIQQVVINLIHNASKNIDKKGIIVISINENDKFIVVSVMDNGCGIENTDKLRVFAEYYQSDDIFSDKIEGIGLGLTIVKHVIEKHKGKIYIGSVRGMGTTFSFTLPKEIKD
jgi:signal transduction histidine kinase